jgi:hypothetical protein
MTRAKFICVSKTETAGNYYDSQTQESKSGTVVAVRFIPVTSGSNENKEFYKSTPSGNVELGGLRKEVADQFQLQKEYYIDFTEATAQ